MMCRRRFIRGIFLSGIRSSLDSGRAVDTELKGVGFCFSGEEGVGEFGGVVALEGDTGGHFMGKHLALGIQTSTMTSKVCSLEVRKRQVITEAFQEKIKKHYNL